MDSWSACHEFEPSTAEDPPCRGGRYTLNAYVESETSSRWYVERRGKCQFRCRPRHMTVVQNIRSSSLR
ncbi:hypothetical protein TNCV_1501671 [Trichonephila clavipes]|uniref:Uncharacterized protein n=1 Tax=Trichonephila clavipes TaxID=2585209 RepID=A0A8X6RTJ5_TRICX|nr:hypothetical protein TNCV_1501671 [Trichonephila clavipes]